MPSTFKIFKGEVRVFTPDLKYAVTFDDSSTLHLWDLEKDSLVCDFEFEDWIRDVQISPDGKRLIASNFKNVIRIWDLETRQRTHTLRGNAEEVQFTWSPDGQFLVISGEEAKIHIMDLVNKRIHKEIRIPEHCASLTWSPDGQQFAIVGVTNIYILDIHSGKFKLKNRQIPYPVNILWNPSGKAECVIRSLLGCYIMDLQNSEIFKIDCGMLCSNYSYSADGRFLVLGNDTELQIYDVEKRKVVHTFKGHISRIVRCFFSKNMREFLTYGDFPDYSVMRWNMEKPKPIKTLTGFQYDNDFPHAYTPDMKYFAHTELKKVCIRETATWKLVNSFSVRARDYIHSLTFSPDGNLLAVSDEQTVQVWDWESKTRVAKSKEPSDGTFDLKFSPDGKYIAGRSTEMFEEIAIWQLEGDVCKKAHTFDVSSRSIYWTSNGKSLLAVWDSDEIIRIDVEKEREIPLTDEKDERLGFYYSGGKYAFIFGAKKAFLLNVSLNKRELFVESDTKKIAISSASKWLAHSENTTDLKIYDLKTKERVQILEAPSNDDSLLEFSPNEKFLSLSTEKRIRLWNTKTWEIVQDLEFPQNVTSVEWSNDSQSIAVIYGGILTVEPVNRI